MNGNFEFDDDTAIPIGEMYPCIVTNWDDELAKM